VVEIRGFYQPFTIDNISVWLVQSLKAGHCLSPCCRGGVTGKEETLNRVNGSHCILLFHRTSRFGSAAEPAVKTVHIESRAGTSFPPR
jgi:hypothetical protein